MSFTSVSSQVDFVALEKEILDYWEKQKILDKYLHKNDSSDKKFSFLDGPITANNPMGVHHAWGRTYKDLWQRYFNMQGFKQRFQNGFDEQGLWVEVEVEKELGFKNKKDIEKFGIDKFVNLCKERVKKFASIQTEQSKRLGYFMNWDNSYHTSSDENNFAIWNFLKVVHEKGWLYKGRDSVPWCPRCGTAISQHEILTEEYKEVEHESVYLKLPIKDRENEFLLVWTTTPWTIPANVAVAVDPKKEYLKIKQGNEFIYLMSERAKALGFDGQKVSGKDLVGLEYDAPFDHLPRVPESLGGYIHRVIETDDLILSISAEEGTGLVHVATGAGSEDFKLGLKFKLPVIEVIDEEGSYLDGMEEFSNQNAKNNPELIIDFLREKDSGRFLFKTEKIKHRYPTCWRCKTELVWRVVDEWYISMDQKDDSDKTYREQMIEVAKKINWIPKWGLDRELDWLKNMHDWLISKKRYWGLALPIWECSKCDNFEVIGGKEELKEKAVGGWDKFEGNSPHRPWIDQIKIKCSKCGEIALRVLDVGNPWLDAGIVPFSTLPSEWFPADFITESFPGQFKNWFYSLIAMSTVLKKDNPFKTVLGFASVRDEKGDEMHKSKGNSIEFNEAADKIGVDVMRWLYLRTNPEHNVNFGYNVLDELRRMFIIKLWNVYSFFVTYANLYNFKPKKEIENFAPIKILDKWILSRMSGNIKNITSSMEKYDAMNAMGNIEIFLDDLSNWYLRRIRNRVSRSENLADRDEALQTLWIVLSEYSRVLAPFIPFVAEAIFTNLTNKKSVHLADWPNYGPEDVNEELEKQMSSARLIASGIHELRKENNIKVRIPLRELKYSGPQELSKELLEIVLDETNIYKLQFLDVKDDWGFGGEVSESNQDLDAGQARELIRQIQQLRKDQNLTLADRTKVSAPSWPKQFESLILKSTCSVSILPGNSLVVSKV